MNRLSAAIAAFTGQNNSAISHAKSALQLDAAFRKAHGLPEVMTYIEIKDDNAEYYIQQLCIFASTHIFPLNFTIDLEPPPNSKTSRCVTAKTLQGYIGKIIKGWRVEFPDHPDWKHLTKADDVPDWWTSLRVEFLSSCNRFQQTAVRCDAVFGVAGTKPLYTDLRSRRNDKDPDSIKNNPLAHCDLRGVVIRLVKSANEHNKKLQELAQVNLTHVSFGRAGEQKFSNYNKWEWDMFLQVPDTGWQESKTLNSYSMPQITNEFWGFDFFVCMGAFYMCDNGLLRTGEHEKNGSKYAVFPDLQSINNNSVARRIGKIIKENLPDVPESVLAFFSAKSLRYGAITHATAFNNISIFQVSARSGHSVGGVTPYIDGNNALLGLPAANALAGNHLNMEPVVPTLDVVGDSDGVKALIDNMFKHVSIDEFKRGGSLWRVLEVCAASLIRHHVAIMNDCGGLTNRITTCLNIAARDANIRDPANPGLSPEQVIVEWSKTVQQDYNERFKIAKVQASSTTADGNDATILSMLASISSDVQEIKSERRSLLMECAGLKADVSQLQNQNGVLKAQVRESNRRVQLLMQSTADTDMAAAKTPTLLSRKRQRVDESRSITDGSDLTAQLETTAGTGSGATAAAKEVDVGTGSGSPAAMEVTDTAAVSVPALPALTYNNDARTFGEEKGDSKLRFMNVLRKLATNNQLHPTDIGKTNIPNDISNKQALRNCLEMAVFAGSSDDISIMRGASEGDKVQAAFRLEEAVKDKLLELEDTGKTNKEYGGSILGLHKRINAYRNRVKKAKKSSAQPSTMPLIELNELLALEGQLEASTGASEANGNSNRRASVSGGQTTLDGIPRRPRPQTKRLHPSTSKK